MDKTQKTRLAAAESFRDELMRVLLGTDVKLSRLKIDALGTSDMAGKPRVTAEMKISTHLTITTIELYRKRDASRVKSIMDETGRNFELLAFSMVAANRRVDYAYPYLPEPRLLQFYPKFCVLDCIIAPGRRRRTFFRRLTSAINETISTRMLRQL